MASVACLTASLPAAVPAAVPPAQAARPAAVPAARHLHTVVLPLPRAAARLSSKDSLQGRPPVTPRCTRHKWNAREARINDSTNNEKIVRQKK